MFLSTRAFCSPKRYIQGPGEVENLPAYCQEYGKRVLAVVDCFLFDAIRSRMEPLFKAAKIELLALSFAGECCEEEVERLGSEAQSFGADVLVGMGGGKTLDAVKLLANRMNLPLIVVPTSASTDAPTSSLSVLYSKEGVYIKNVRHRRNADLVLMDSEIIANAPVRLLVAGMGDALATYFEARANLASNHNNLVGKGYKMCQASYAIAKLCYEILLDDGLKAKKAVENRLVTPALENIIEANTLMSGLGFENSGLACAHGIHAGLTALPESHRFYHGEKVAFGVLCQLNLENAEEGLLEEVMNFMYKLGLPLTLRQIGVTASDDRIRIIASTTAVENKLIQAEPCTVTEDLVFAAIKMTDLQGEQYLQKTEVLRERNGA